MKTDTSDLLARLMEIITAQSGIIDDLFRLLLQHEAAEDIDQKTYEAMQQVAEGTKKCMQIF